MSCLPRAAPQSLCLQLTLRSGIHSAAQRIQGCFICILQLRSPVRTLPSLYKTPMCCCPTSVT